MVLKSQLQDEARALARSEGLARNANPEEADDLVREAQDVIEDVFYSIKWMKVEDGIVRSNDPVDQWFHRTESDIENDWRSLGISRSDLRDAAERYLERPWMRSNKTDWLILDTLTYAEYQGTLDELRAKLMDWDKYIKAKAATENTLPPGKVWPQTSPVRWAIWAAVFLLTFLVAPIGPIAWAGFTSWQLYWSSYARKKVEGTVASMFATYSTFSTICQSWKIVWEELNKSRQKGAVWDGVVYRLVEERTKGR